MADETAFLPAALTLQETPPHPAPRRVALMICALFVIALVWAIVGEVDIVAVAPGRIVVSDRTKTVQPLEAGVVRKVHVKDGDTVRAGQLLVELDATNATADGATIGEQLAVAESDRRRATALLAALETNRLPTSNERGHKLEQSQLAAEWSDITAKLAKLNAEHVHRRAEIATVRELIGKLAETLPIAAQREADFRRLTEQGFVSSHAGQDRTRERIEQERDLSAQRARLKEAQAAAQEAEQAKTAYLAETRRALSERQAQATLKLEQLVQERSKADQRSRLTRMIAPVSGTVQQLAVHTEGGVVTPAQVLMVVVPADAEVRAEVVLENKDIGFVRAGQVAEVKLESLPYTRYGTVRADVVWLGADAVTDEKRGAVFPATLKLLQRHLDVDGKRVALTAGMNLSAEIKTGRRPVIDYLLDPVRRAGAESLKER